MSTKCYFAFTVGHPSIQERRVVSAVLFTTNAEIIAPMLSMYKTRMIDQGMIRQKPNGAFRLPDFRGAFRA